MIEKVNPSHPDKVADRIAGAIVDLAYASEENPKIAVEVLVGHGVCHVIIETAADLNELEVQEAVHRIAGPVEADIVIVPQDKLLADNQADEIRCGDNGIFKGAPLTDEQKQLSEIPENDGGDLYLINGNMTKLADAGIFAADSGRKENEDNEEVLELEDSDGDQPGDGSSDSGANTLPERNHRGRKLV